MRSPAAAAATAAGRRNGSSSRLRLPEIDGLLPLMGRCSSRSRRAGMPCFLVKRLFCQDLQRSGSHYRSSFSTGTRWTQQPSCLDSASLAVSSSHSSFFESLPPLSSASFCPRHNPSSCPSAFSWLLASSFALSARPHTQATSSLARAREKAAGVRAAAAAERAATEAATTAQESVRLTAGGVTNTSPAAAKATATTTTAATAGDPGRAGGGAGGWQDFWIRRERREVNPARRSGKRFFATSLEQGRPLAQPAASSASARQYPVFDEAEAAEAEEEAKAQLAATATGAALENRPPVRVLRSSCTDILRNLAIESLLIDICGRPRSPLATGTPSTETCWSPSSSYPVSTPCESGLYSALPFSSSAAVAAAAVGGSMSCAAAVDFPAAASSRTQQHPGGGQGERSISSNKMPELQQVPVLFLWRNDKTIVIGRHQNAWKECDIRSMERDGVTLARRYSGGGAVYQDLGNTCFTFLDPAEQHCKQRNSRILLRALRKKYDITGSFSGRNDLLTEDGRKFSGFAYSKFPRMWLHHGTLMRDVDCKALAQYLTPSKAKLQSKGVDSVAARVANLRTLRSNITHEGLCEAIAASFMEQHGGPTAAPVEMEEVEDLLVDNLPVHQHPIFRKHYDLLSSWDWRFGHSPAFTTELSTRFPWGSFDVHMNVERAVIRDIKIFSDCMHPDLVDAFTTALKGCRFTEKDLRTAIMSVMLEKPPADLPMMLEDFANWIVTDTQH